MAVIIDLIFSRLEGKYVTTYKSNSIMAASLAIAIANLLDSLLKVQLFHGLL
ncbi:MAG: hypothetical protein AAFQ14_18075 [Cyanobacteria bacterium J06621_12]